MVEKLCGKNDYPRRYQSLVCSVPIPQLGVVRKVELRADRQRLTIEGSTHQWGVVWDYYLEETQVPEKGHAFTCACKKTNPCKGLGPYDGQLLLIFRHLLCI